ncbi:MAG: sugar phosphate isomerase/epimerase family protein [Phycisphaerales bacterium]
MHRREFLAAASLATIATTLHVRVAAQPPTMATSHPKRTLRKAVMYGMIGVEGKVFDKFSAIRDAGFEGVEMDSPSSIPGDEILAAQERTGIKVHGLVDSKHWAIPLNVPDEMAQAEAVAALETCLRDAKRFGSTSILLVPGVVNAGLPYDECWRLSLANIRKAMPLARELGVTIAIENVWNNFITSPLEAERYLDELNDPLAAWHFDIGNVINFGWPEQWIRILGKRIVKLHIKDFSRKKRDAEGLWKGFGVELGEGDAGWPAVMRALDEVGYSTATPGNWATAEVGGGDAKRLKQVSEQMDRLFAM